MVKVVLIILAVTAGLGAAIEVILRVLLGFGNPLIYIADAECGYLLAPNQKVRRLGNRIEINEYSMRILERSPLHPLQKLCVFCCWEILSPTAVGGHIRQIRSRKLWLGI